MNKHLASISFAVLSLHHAVIVAVRFCSRPKELAHPTVIGYGVRLPAAVHVESGWPSGRSTALLIVAMLFGGQLIAWIVQLPWQQFLQILSPSMTRRLAA